MKNHKSDCAVYNEPAYPKGICDCGVGTKYRKKPVVIEAMQYLRDENIAACMDFCKNMKYDPSKNEYFIETLEGNMAISKNDYIIKGVSGEFYPCKPDIFEKTYEVAE